MRRLRPWSRWFVCGSALPGAIALSLLSSKLYAADEPQILTPSPSAYDTLSRFANLLDTLHKSYVDPSSIDARTPTTAALREFVRSIDPDSDLLTPDEVAAAAASPSEAVAGIGVSLTIRNDYPTVVTPLDGSIAQTAGLLAGDQITAINGKPTVRARLFEVNRTLRGIAGSTVSLAVLDPTDGKMRELILKRSPPRPSSEVPLKFLSDGVAYCRLAEITAVAVGKLYTQLQRADKESARALILDIRNNPGGTFDAAQVAAQFFLAPQAKILTLDYPNPSSGATFVSDNSKKITLRLALLVNGGTAAEAEIFAAALRDNNRAQLVGSKTFGRGRLYSQVPMSGGDALRLPVACFMPPSGKPFQGTGIVPDTVVPLQRDIERRLATAGFGSFDWLNDRPQLLATDFPLAKALELLAK